MTDEVKQQPVVCEDVPSRNLRHLAAAVIARAVYDLANPRKKFLERLDAFLWLTSSDFEIWKDWAEAGELDVFKMLPNLRQIGRRLQAR